MVFHIKMVLAFRYGDDDERWCWWWDWRFWKPFPQQNEFGVQLTEIISTTKWFWHFGTVMITVMMMNDSVDDEIEDSSGGDDDERWWWFNLFPRLVRFVLFCLVSFGGVGSNYVGIYARCIRISLCTITAPFTRVIFFTNLKNDILLFVNWTNNMLNKKIKAPVKICLDEFHFDNICKWVNMNFLLSLYVMIKRKKKLRRPIQVTTETRKTGNCVG